MIKRNLVKIMLLVFTCKSATNIVHNKRKHSEVSSESEEHRYEHIKRPYTSILSDVSIGLDISTNPEVYELEDFLFENIRKESSHILEESALPNAESKEDLFTTFFKELEQLETELSCKNANEIQEICDEFFSITPLDEISTAFSSEEESSVTANIQSIILREDPKDMVSHEDALERLQTLYADFARKIRTKNKSDVLNRCFALFPETIVLLYIKVKNNESNECINSILLKIYNIYKNNIVYSRDTIDVIYKKRINFRKEMVNILQFELPNLNNILLYEKLANLEETLFNIQISRSNVKFIYTKIITNIFNIIFMLEDENVLLLLSKSVFLLDHVSEIGFEYVIATLSLDILNLKSIMDRIFIMKEIYDYILPYIPSFLDKRQKFNEYFNSEMRKLQNAQKSCLFPIDIYKILKGLEIYKETFEQCSLCNTSNSIKFFFPNDSVVVSKKTIKNSLAFLFIYFFVKLINSMVKGTNLQKIAYKLILIN